MTNRSKATIRFLVIAGGSLGLLRTIPAYAALHNNIALAAGVALLTGVLVLALLWHLIRRRDLSTKSAAVHLVAVLWIGLMLAEILTHPVAQRVAPDLTWRTFAAVAIAQTLVAPVEFLVAALLIHIGRLLPASGRPAEPGDAPVAAPGT